MEKSDLAGEGGGARPPPFSLLPSRTKLQCTLLLSGQKHSSYQDSICTLWTVWPVHHIANHRPSTPLLQLGRAGRRIGSVLHKSLASSLEIILTTAPVFFHDLSFIYRYRRLRNNSRTQEQSEKIAISSLRVNDREPCSVAHNTRVYTKKVFNNFRNLSIFHFVIVIQLLIPLGRTHKQNKKIGEYFPRL
jgi:hypothetical protein